jgi:hypothetical protein
LEHAQLYLIRSLLVIQILLDGGLLVEVHPGAAEEELGLQGGARMEPARYAHVDNVDSVRHQQLVHVVRGQLHKVLSKWETDKD